MCDSRRRLALYLNSNLKTLQEGTHYYKDDLKPPLEEKMLYKNPDPEERDNEQSKKALARMALTSSTRRDIFTDIMNPRQELSKYTYGVDELLPFDQAPVSLMTPYDTLAMQGVQQVIKGINSWKGEETKYDATMENQQEIQAARKDKALRSMKGVMSQYDPPPTRRMQAELARASLMETTQSL